MMKVWVLQGIHEGELFSSVHLTEKGAALAAIGDVLEFLGVEDEQSALDTMNRCNSYRATDGDQTDAYEWDWDKLNDMTREQLWKIFGDWAEMTWDNCYGYQVDVDVRTMQA